MVSSTTIHFTHPTCITFSALSFLVREVLSDWKYYQLIVIRRSRKSYSLFRHIWKIYSESHETNKHYSYRRLIINSRRRMSSFLIMFLVIPNLLKLFMWFITKTLPFQVYDIIELWFICNSILFLEYNTIIATFQNLRGGIEWSTSYYTICSNISHNLLYFENFTMSTEDNSCGDFSTLITWFIMYNYNIHLLHYNPRQYTSGHLGLKVKQIKNGRKEFYYYCKWLL